LLAQARTLTEYLREQPDGWLSAHHLMKSLRHDTLRAIPAPDAQGRTASSRQSGSARVTQTPLPAAELG
jgi:hypothetical protein